MVSRALDLLSRRRDLATESLVGRDLPLSAASAASVSTSFSRTVLGGGGSSSLPSLGFSFGLEVAEGGSVFRRSSLEFWLWGGGGGGGGMEEEEVQLLKV